MSQAGRGEIVIGYDGSEAADRAIDAAGALLSPARAVVVVVWEPGLALNLTAPGLVPAPIDVRRARGGRSPL